MLSKPKKNATIFTILYGTFVGFAYFTYLNDPKIFINRFVNKSGMTFAISAPIFIVSYLYF